MKTNTKASTPKIKTYEGAAAVAVRPLEELKRAVLSCLLFEDTFYESGSDLAARIEALVPQAPVKEIANLAVSTRNDHGLRHVSLFLAMQLLKHPDRKAIRVADVIAGVCKRADEPAELLAMYYKDGRKPLAAQLKVGLAKAIKKFGAYAIGKYKGEGNAVKLRDVMFMTHPKPQDDAQGVIWKQFVDGVLPVPDTWEVALSAGADKKETWERLIAEDKLGGLAMLRNLRNMTEAKVSLASIKAGLLKAKYHGVLPFQFFSAAQMNPTIEQFIEPLMLEAVKDLPALAGSTGLLVDTSGSMQGAKVSAKSILDRLDAAAALAVLLREKCEDVRVATFADQVVTVPSRRGFALRDAIRHAPSGGTYLKGALTKLKASWNVDRMIVVTDEQSHDGTLPAWTRFAYNINVAPYAPGLNYTNGWTHINGWSDRIAAYIVAVESAE